MKFIRSLGQGGFGNVDLLEDSNGIRYARKTFSVNQPLAPSLVSNVKRRFIREAKVQAGLSHRNIVPIVGDDLESDPPYFLMPAAQASLADDIAEDRTLGGRWKEAVMDIIAGLDELHSLDMCHRDLKPQNVLRFEGVHEERAFYAISDFGFISIKDSRLSALTKTGMARGSDFYTAPEIVGDLKNARPQSDIYSLGCIIHDMIGREDRVPCNEIRESGPFGPILLSCTRQELRRRFRSARAVADALLATDDDEVVPSTARGATLAAALDGPNPLDEAMWRSLVEYLDSNIDPHERRLIFLKLTADRIREICGTLPDEARKLGMLHARWIHDSSFNFDACDTLAVRLETFYELCGIEVKAECLLAMLSLGTSHNRWFVERKFMALCGRSMDPTLARRLAVEFRANDVEVCVAIAHLEGSIGASRNDLHSILASTLSSVCP
jgi:serine/threonine protein kinase